MSARSCRSRESDNLYLIPPILRGRLADHLAQGPLLDHQAHHFIESISRRHGRVLGIGVVCRRDLDDIGSDEVDTFQPTNNGSELSSRPPTRLGGPGSRGNYVVLAVVGRKKHRKPYKRDRVYQYRWTSTLAWSVRRAPGSS